MAAEVQLTTLRRRCLARCCCARASGAGRRGTATAPSRIHPVRATRGHPPRGPTRHTGATSLRRRGARARGRRRRGATGAALTRVALPTTATLRIGRTGILAEWVCPLRATLPIGATRRLSPRARRGRRATLPVLCALRRCGGRPLRTAGTLAGTLRLVPRRLAARSARFPLARPGFSRRSSSGPAAALPAGGIAPAAGEGVRCTTRLPTGATGTVERHLPRGTLRHRAGRERRARRSGMHLKAGDE